ncbi:MAG TPA: lipocalin-like domain-containing protein [Candidatus Sulfotelmatobacter sp.]|nr:lipocalin-like domain-containing protein [Candidatus Sulfotelmatobacter sp.]
MKRVFNILMRRSQTISLLLLSLVLFSSLAAARSAQAGTSQNPLIGAWKLVSLEDPSSDGQMHKADCAGQFVFTNDGKASVQVMYRSAQTGSAYAQSGYEASYGSYDIDDSSTFTFHIDGALVRTLIGKDLKRAYEISGKRLTVKSTDPNEHWKVIWERY